MTLRLRPRTVCAPAIPRGPTSMGLTPASARRRSRSTWPQKIWQSWRTNSVTSCGRPLESGDPYAACALAPIDRCRLRKEAREDVVDQQVVLLLEARV